MLLEHGNIHAMATIIMSGGDIAIVDDDDVALVSESTWRKSRTGYAQRNSRTSRHILMHRLILDAPDCSFIDHVNGNKLDNRRENLRFCTREENARNCKARGGASKFKGVSKSCGKWRATTQMNGRQVYLGMFPTEEEAALAYDTFARRNFGEFARLNFPGLSIDVEPSKVPKKSEFRGVTRDSGRWKAFIKDGNCLYNLGRYTVERHASEAHEAARKLRALLCLIRNAAKNLRDTEAA